MSIDYSLCKFEARLQKNHFLRKNDSFYLYVSPDKIIINTQPYAKRPWLVLQLLATTHVKWLWESRRGRVVESNRLKGFIIQTEGHMYEFNGEKIVLDQLKTIFKGITLQSDFSDQYVLGKYIDKGNYAQVFQCVRKDNGDRLAVKILQKQRLKSMKNGKESVFNELKVLRGLNHRNLMRLFQVYEDRNKYYFILELLQGVTLHKQIASRRKKNHLKPHQIRSIIRQMLQGIRYLQQEGIMHRDIKPENILFEDKDSLDKNNAEHGLKIVDYGLATYHTQPTIIFTKCGTPGYVAPEIITYDQKEKIYNLNVDTFSVGVIFHILLVGEQSFVGKSRNTILNKNKECKIDYKAKKYEEIAGDGIDLLSRLLQKSPEKRITAAEALNHPFLSKDRPIFKFKKVYREEEKTENQVPMQMYRNLEDIFAEEESPQQSKKQSPSSTFHFNASVLNKYTQFLNYYDPFCHELIQHKHEPAFPDGSEKHFKYTFLSQDKKESKDEPAIQIYPQAQNLFSYQN